jgi:hypothetical protein
MFAVLIEALTETKQLRRTAISSGNLQGERVSVPFDLGRQLAQQVHGL